jgi:hypothetical protein
MTVLDLVPGSLGLVGGISFTGDDDNIKAYFSFVDDGSKAFLNFGASGDDVGSGASLSFNITV